MHPKPVLQKAIVYSILIPIQFFVFTVHAQMRQLYVDANASNQINKISFYSPGSGFVAFANWIGYTTDSGRTYTQMPVTNANVNYNGYSVNLTFGFDILGVKAFNQNTLIAYGDYGLVPAILSSADGGNTFTLIFLSQYNPNQLSTGITSMIFPQNDNIGFAVDADRILKTTDQGLTWAVIATYPGSFFDYLEAVDDNHVYAFSIGTHTNKLLATTNSGASWQQLTLPAGSLNYASFVSAGNGWVDLTDNNNNGDLYYTSNGGASWTQKNNALATPFICKQMRFINDSTGYATMGLFQVYKTSDSGKLWEPLPRDNNFTYLGYTFNDLQYMSNNQLWAGGGHGFLELGTAGGGTPLPRAFFLIDTSGLSGSGLVHLTNYSRPTYSYQWFRNDTLFSTAYNAVYTHAANRSTDTIMLIVSSGGQSDTTSEYQSFYPPVTITSFNPVAAAHGTVVTINGSHFTGATSVSFGGTPASGYTVVSDGLISATVGAGSSGNVVVGTPTGAAQLSGFTFVSAPSISAFSPQSATAGTTITIQGTHFTGTTQVYFGSTAASSFTVVSDGEITALPASGSTGAVEVINAGGTATLTGFVELPFISSFTPTAGSNGAQITITGTGFTSVTSVTVGGDIPRSVVVNSSTNITAIIGSGATGSVIVNTAAGSATLAGFSYTQALGSITITPLAGPVGTTVTITGSNFNPSPAANTVYFGLVKAPVTAASPTSLTVTVPVATTYSPVSVTTNGLTSWTDKPFLLTFPGGGSISTNSFGPDIDFSYLVPSSDVSGFAVGDIDGDGKPDMVEAEGIIGGINVVRNTGSPGTISFAVQTGFLSSYTAGQLALTDIDGDGRPELLALINGTIYVFANQSTPGNIAFGPPTVIALSGGTLAYGIGDIDGDGRLDLIISSGYFQTLSVLLNSSSPGSFSFTAPVPTGIPAGGPEAVADLDGDGKPDLVVMHATSDSLAVVRNTSTVGNVSFSYVVDLPANLPTGIFVGDVDGDGRPDIEISNSPNTVSVFRNTTAGGISFAPRVDLSAGNNPGGISLSDMDGDGKPDMVVTNYSDTTVSVFKNESTPGTVAFSNYINYSIGYRGGNSSAVVLFDMDGDGKNDIGAVNTSQFDFHTLRNTVSAEPFIRSYTPTIGSAGTSVTILGTNFTGVTAVSFGGVPAASFTIDSATGITAILGAGATGDIAVTNPFGTTTASGFTYGAPPVITAVSPLSGPVGTTVTITGTNFNPVPSSNIVFFGQVQAAVSSATTTSLTVTVPSGTTYGPITVTTSQQTGYFSRPFIQTFAGGGAPFNQQTFIPEVFMSFGYAPGAVADLDGDGKLDIVCASAGGQQILRNTSIPGKISFAAPTAFSATSSPSMAVGDIDGDGKLDIVTGNGNNSFSFFKNISTPGNIAFAGNIDFSTGDPNSEPGGITIADIDHDGRPDIITISYVQQTMSVFRNISTNGQVAFDTRVVYDLYGYPNDVHAADLDEDGLIDIALATTGGASVFRNTSVPGAISFAPRQDFATGGAWPEGLKIVDVDGDGKLDLAVANSNSNQLTIFLNLSMPGNLSFGTAINFVTGNGPWSVLAGDLDGNGQPDLITPNTSQAANYGYGVASMSIFQNGSSPGDMILQPQVSYPCTGPQYGGIGDMDGDGRPDIVIWGGNLTVFRNEIGAPPPSFSPAAGYTGQTISISGAGFNVAGGVTLGGTSSQSFRVASDTSMTAVVGTGASGNLIIQLASSDSIVLPGFVYLPLPSAASIGPIVICAGSADTLVSSVDSNNQWYKNGVLLLNDTGSRLVATDSGVYTVAGSFGGVVTPPSAGITVAIIPVPPTPVISLDSGLLISSADSGNQWYIDTTAIIPGANGQRYKPVNQGYYAVTVTSDGCTSPLSAGYAYTPPPVAPAAVDSILIAPNPARSTITISFDTRAINSLNLEISGLNGSLILSRTNVQSGNQIDISTLARGIYIIRLQGNDGQIKRVARFIKL